MPFAVVSNPEFLKEGAAVEDFMRPDRVVIGADDERAIALLRAVYAPFQRNHERLLVMDVRSAELTKYAANAMLATRISFMNELANLADALGADIEHVRQGIGSDPRIGYHFLYPGVGYGGSCFPKDVKALQRTARQHGRPLRILAAVEAVNEAQKTRLVDKIVARLGDDLAGQALRAVGTRVQAQHRRHARGAVARDHRGACSSAARTVAAYDPVAMDEARRVFGDDAGLVVRGRRRWPPSTGADALVVVTEWKEFRSPDFAEIKRRLRQPLLFDGRNLFDPAHGARRRARVLRDRPRDDDSCERLRALRREFRAVAIARRDARAGRRRRDARSLLVRRRRAHFAGGAGAGREDRAQRGASRRRGERRAQRRGAGRAGDAASASSATTSRGARSSGCCRRAACAPRSIATRALPTTVKLRVIGRQQQLLRIDFETVPSHEVLAAKLADYERALADFDVVVLSDYGKGGLAHIARMIALAAGAASRCWSIPRATITRAIAARRC